MSEAMEVAANSADRDPASNQASVQAGAEASRKDLKRRTARGALVSTGAQLATLVLRTGSMMVLARLLTPGEFGLVTMVTAFTGFLGLFRDAGLSMATVQREAVTQAQTSTLFWINLALGGVLTLVSVGLGPLLATFYHEPRLFWVTAALGVGFLFNGGAAQHRAVLLRELRFGALAAVEVVSLLVGIGVGIGMAVAGCSYWALVGMAVTQPAAGAVGMWVVTGWIPGRPQRNAGIRSMLQYGGTVTVNSVIVYLAYNAEKVLLGRFWGAEMLGVYGRAYQLISLPTENLNSTIGQVAFPALARVQNEPERLRNYFLKGYGLFLSLVMPITVACGLFAEDIILVLAGRQWGDAVPVFRLLSPTILAFALINPFAWLMLATGQTGRSLKIALMIAPVVILGYLLGLRQGPQGVAIGYSAAMLLLVAPMILWAKRGTLITTVDVLKVILRPLLSVGAGAAVAAAVAGGVQGLESALLRLIVNNAVLFGVYLILLLFVMGQKPIYLDLLRETGLWRSRPAGAKPGCKT